MSDVAIRPVSPDKHDAVMHYFDMVASADNPNWSKCFCMERLVDDYAELVDVPGDRLADVGAIVCFVVAPDQRRQGIATQLLDAALEHLRGRAMKTAEAYPKLGDVDPARWVWSQYVGPLSMYVKAGFEIAEKGDDFCIVRKKL